MEYRLDVLGWYNFEALCQTLLKKLIGPGVTSFGRTGDGGRDATYRGVASYPSETDRWSGYWVFQVKHVDVELRGADIARAAVLAAAKNDITSLLARGRGPDNYILLTNVPLTAGNRDELDAAVPELGFKGKFKAIDGVEVCEFLRLNIEIRRSFPQLLGLADLSVIVNSKIYARSRAFVEFWQPRLATFVRTRAFDEALQKLHRSHFIVLDGPPEAGKTMIAAALALWHASVGFEVVDLRESGDFFSLFDEGRSQLFVADDAVGSNALDPSRADDWTRDLPGILRKRGDNHLLIWTTRKYVLEEALSHTRLGESINLFPGVHEVLVEVGQLSIEERAGILYNHAKQSRLSEADRGFFRLHARDIVNHRNFTPERIRQMFDDFLDELREGGAT